MRRRDLFAPMGAAFMASFLPIPAMAQNPRNATGYIRTNWSKDPFSCGSYSYVAREAKQLDRQRLEAPIANRIFFAGEAVHPDYNSTVHAAYESGIRTANSVKDTSAHKIAVIGAGISGLAAAHALFRAGRDVEVFEARDRIGGRLWTDNRLGVPLDLGASWIHGINGNPLTTIADKLDLARIVTPDSDIIRVNGGQEIDEEDAPSWLEDVIYVQHDAGAERDQINVDAYLAQDDYSGDEVILPDGYAQILKHFSGTYPVKLRAIIQQISLASSGVDLVINNADEQRFDAVIVTVPLGVLKRGDIGFSPPLPDHKKNAIARLGMGVLDKFVLKFDDVFWDKEVTWLGTPDNGLPPGQFNQWLNLYKFIGAPILMGFNGGTPALDLSDLSDDEMLDRALSTLNGAYPI
ncbi:FAD-dependent oxidoreductase [Maritalea sp.]|uniref:flavin monoamine oxidase family protein n=1 Tax=Maritalea sp. TaxID=2003361 RepID=UPI003EF72A2B